MSLDDRGSVWLFGLKTEPILHLVAGSLHRGRCPALCAHPGRSDLAAQGGF